MTGAALDREVERGSLPQPMSSLFDAQFIRSNDLIQEYVARQALAVFVSNTKPDFRVMRPLNVYHGLDNFLGHFGARVNRDIVIDRTRNGVMKLPMVQGKRRLQVPVNYPLIPPATDLSKNGLVVKDLDAMLFPFVSTVELVDPAPPDSVTSPIGRPLSVAQRTLPLGRLTFFTLTVMV